MPEDVGGTPSFPDGWEPDDDHDRGGADEEFASVVFDEDFVRAAEIHEPSAVERLLAAAQARAEATEAENRRARMRGPAPDAPDDEYYDDGFDPEEGEFGHDDLDEAYEHDPGDRRYGRPGRRLGRARWHRPVAWMLALLMGVGMVALAFTAVYRGASSGRQDQVPAPASTEVGPSPDSEVAVSPSASAEFGRPAVPAVPRTP
ncbi:SCO2584 family spore wall biosynthesis protein [Streptomyces flavofungini]|uniref:SCO2584 family spore wall biosynthesis protein n=1 Tax=Streptomyces flavofungini TaxID=68200 RepID=UPI0034DE1708